MRGFLQPVLIVELRLLIVVGDCRLLSNQYCSIPGCLLLEVFDIRVVSKYFPLLAKFTIIIISLHVYNFSPTFVLVCFQSFFGQYRTKMGETMKFQ